MKWPSHSATQGRASKPWLIAAVFLVLAASACSNGASSGAPTVTGTTALSATVGPTPSPSTVVETNVLSAGEQQLEPGTYVIDLDSRGTGDDEFPNISLAVPEGWTNVNGWGITFAPETKRWMGITFWDVDEVYAHPCSWDRPRIQPGPTAADLAEVLTTRPLRNATVPIGIEVDGYSGMELEWSVPDEIDFSTCHEDAEGASFESWTAAPGSWNTDRYQQGPGQVDRLWILDVDAQRLVLDAMYMPGATAEDVAMLLRVMDSLRFET